MNRYLRRPAILTPLHMGADVQISLDDPAFERRILAEGDSWFSIGALPSSNLLNSLQFLDDTLIYNIAYPGDTIKNMADLNKNQELENRLVKRNFATRWDLILLSGGGNDLIDLADAVVKSLHAPSNNAADYVDQAKLDAGLLSVGNSYQAILGYRDAHDQLFGKRTPTPVVMHCYDYAMPVDKGAKFVNLANISGPWLYPVMVQKAVPPGLWLDVVEILINALKQVLSTLAATHKALRLVDTTQTLTPGSSDWLNEIHPSSTGYDKIAARMSPVLNRLLYL